MTVASTARAHAAPLADTVMTTSPAPTVVVLQRNVSDAPAASVTGPGGRGPMTAATSPAPGPTDAAGNRTCGPPPVLVTASVTVTICPAVTLAGASAQRERPEGGETS